MTKATGVLAALYLRLGYIVLVQTDDIGLLGAFAFRVSVSDNHGQAALIKRPRHPAQQHEGAGGAGVSQIGQIGIAGVLLEFGKGAIKGAQEVVRGTETGSSRIRPAVSASDDRSRTLSPTAAIPRPRSPAANCAAPARAGRDRALQVIHEDALLVEQRQHVLRGTDQLARHRGRPAAGARKPSLSSGLSELHGTRNEIGHHYQRRAQVFGGGAQRQTGLFRLGPAAPAPPCGPLTAPSGRYHGAN